VVAAYKLRKSKSGLVRILPIEQVRPSPENEELYRPVDPYDPQIADLAESIRLNGFNSAIVISQDYYILSGHRRVAAAKLVGLKELPCIVEEVHRWGYAADGVWGPTADYIRKLEMYNRQRDKTLDEMMRESVVKADPKDAHRALSEHREKRSSEFYSYVDTVELRESKKRAEISNAKMPFVRAIIGVVNEMREYWPLSDRQIHYALLNDPPLRHASKPASRYNNTREEGKSCYKDLTDLLTRMRLAGIIPFDCIQDETRPVTITACYQHAGLFLQKETDSLFKGYYRDLMQSQPNHVEVLYEKLTGYSFISTIALRYCIPLTVSRGFPSIPPRHDIAQRYRKSGKDKLVILAMTDLDPDGDEIAHSFARSMRDDFSIENTELIKVALTMDQATGTAEINGRKRKLPVSDLDKAKTGSASYERYVYRYGTDSVWELEALSPPEQQQLLEEAIGSVVDVDAYNHEVEEEEREAAHLDEQRQRALLAMRTK